MLARDLDAEAPGRRTPCSTPTRIDDDVLALMFVSCHPVLSQEARIALTLRVVGGLTSDEIARAFLVPVADGAGTDHPRQEDAGRRAGAVRGAGAGRAAPSGSARCCSVLYLIFTEGSFASGGEDWIRTTWPARRSGWPGCWCGWTHEPEAFGLLALLELTAARFPARLDAAGEPVLLEDQDRRLWDRSAIRRGRAALARAAGPGAGLGAYGLQASIAECHAVAPSVAETDWPRIVLLYEALGRLAPSPVVELNRAVAVAMAAGPADGLALVDEIASRGELAQSHLLPAVRGELLTRLGRREEARTALELAVQLCGNNAERAVLERKISEVDGA